ncbi:MAG TPA: hypothetical protein VFM55_03890 [Micromonosporaceae bacterium]|nr:hypothetical protein [Micromonosporaceae bacterium]
MPPTGATLRFVQLRRPSDRAEPAGCSTGPKTIGPVVDFRDAWSTPVKQAVTTRNVQRARTLYADRLQERDDRLEEIGRLALRLLRRAAVDADLTVGALRAALASWTADRDVPAGHLRGAVAELTGWAVDVLTLGRFLRRPKGSTPAALTRLLRGITLVRLAQSDAEDGCLVRALVGGRELTLPVPPAVLRPPDPDAERAGRLAGLSREIGRLQARARITGRPDPTLADVQSGGFQDLAETIDATARAAADLGAPPTIALRNLRRVVEVERDAARRRSALRISTTADGALDDLDDLDPGGFGVELPTTGPVSVPVLDAHARVAGRGDLMILRTTHLRYEPAEISHVENVLASEARVRTHVVDTSTRETVQTSTQSISESTQELESTEQNSLDRALETASTQSTSMSMGVSVSGGFGPVQAGVDINADRSTTTATSLSSAVSYSKTLTERACELLRNEVAERRTITTTTRVTESNEHRFDNADGGSNITGIYRWLNKIDQAQLYNYGERLMLEFVVPEPASTLVHFAQQGADAGAVAAPAGWYLEVEDLDEDNYAEKAARWDVLGIEPPPDPEVFATATFADPAARPFDYHKDSTDKSQPEWGFTSYVGEVAVPAGYAASEAYVTVTWGLEEGEFVTSDGTTPQQAVQIAVGEDRIVQNDASDGESVVAIDHVIPGPLPIGISADQRGGLTVVVRVRCERTEAAYAAWRLRTYEVIRAGYLAKLSAYENDQKLRLARAAYQSDQSPETNRRIEQLELRRACQSVLSGQEFDLFGALDLPADDAPRIDRLELEKEADYIQFFEDLFDWPNLVYLFYPYQWAGRDRWATLRSRTSSDPIHEAFLQAGAARVMVPVRAGFEHAVGRYLATSEIPKLTPRPWRGGRNPYPPIEDLISDALDRPGEEVAVEEPWEVVTPTSLIYLQAGAELDPTI